MLLIVTDFAPDVSFEAVEHKDRSGWYVRLTRPAMLPQQIGDFKTEAEARKWIGAEFGKMAGEIWGQQSELRPCPHD